MTTTDIIMPASTVDALPEVRRIGFRDLRIALAKGFDDFRAMPTHVVFLALIYPVIGVALANASVVGDLLPLLYPLAAGFALIGPLAAIWLFELSRRREQGLDTSWRHAFDVVHSPSFPAILELGLLLIAMFAIWIACAQSIYVAYFGYAPLAAGEFATRLFTTPEGQGLILVGNLVGLGFAILAGAIGVVSFPLLLDRQASAFTAIVTSLKVVIRNPLPMAAWGLMVAVALAIGSAPFFVGLAVVVPVLGHATWHLYRRVLAPETGPRPEYRPKPRGIHYAADFPASLFVASRRERD